MPDRKGPPATRHDLRELEAQIAARIARTTAESDKQLAKHFAEQMTNAIVESEKRLTQHFDDRMAKTITDSEQNVLRHFDLAVETIHHDLAGANADEIESIRDDIGLIKSHVGLAPA